MRLLQRNFSERTESATAVNAAGHPEPAFRHLNPDGTVGGWIAASAVVPSSCWLHPLAIVLSGAVLSEGLQIREALVIDATVASRLTASVRPG